MALARWQDLCIDAVDVAAQADFWAAVTGLTRTGALDHTHLVGPTPAHTVWVNAVDRPHEAKTCVHLDVDVASVEDLVALGAAVLHPAERTGFAWHVMADPEGNEFCAFVRPPERLGAQRLHGVVVDCTDPEGLARWWAAAFGAEPAHDVRHDWWGIPGVAVDGRVSIDFEPVPETPAGPGTPTTPQRVHWDVVGEVDDLLAVGASFRWRTPGWTVLADPEGHDFCVFAPA